ncbi:MAG: DUF5330 domain-containing protein [Rhizobium sp.]|nr:DUF5330 domain-containing protein [Rhizobium sp.]
MWFLIKGAFWCSMTLVVLSFFSSQPTEDTAGGPRLEMGDAIAAATDAYQYLSAICTEKPDVCEKGAETFKALGERAREGALVAYQILDSQFADDGAAKDDAPALAEEEPARPALAAEVMPDATAPVADGVTTGTVVPQSRPKTGNGPKPYTPPKL